VELQAGFTPAVPKTCPTKRRRSMCHSNPAGRPACRLLLFGDAKDSLTKLVNAVKAA